jgi:tetratricopeptide (TPR) repeat protein
VSWTVTNDRFLKWAIPLLVLTFLTQAYLSSRLDRWVHPAPFETSTAGELDPKVVSSLRAAAFLSGYKVLIGHAFWIRVIQYYGDGFNGADRFSKLYDYCRLASDLNPQFLPVYTYGSSVLAYQLHRVDEAVKLLQRGIEANPKANRLKLLLAAIAYHNSDNYEREIPFLEMQIAQGSAPTMLINILANTYKKVGRTDDAIRLWLQILKTTDSDVQKYEAAQKLKELYAISKTKPSSEKVKP